MADSAIAVTAGSGNNLDTRTEATNGDHRQVIVVGDPSTNAGVAPVDATNGLTVNAAAGATSIAANEDDASANGDRGVKVLAIQKASPADTAGSDGDYAMLQISGGKLWTSVSAPSGAFASGSIAAGAIATGATSIAANEDDASSNGDTGVKILVKRSDTPAATSGTDGDYEPLQVSGGFLWVRNTSKFITAQTDVTRPNDTTAYAANDAMSDSTSAPTSGGFTISNVVRASGGSGIITDAWICSSNNPGTLLQGEIHLFETSVTNVNDNAAFGISDSEVKTEVGYIPFTLNAHGNNSFAHVQNLNIGFTCSGSANLRFLIKVKNAYTPAAQEVLTVKIKVLAVD